MIGRTRETDEGLMAVDVAGLFAEREGDRYALHTRYLNEQMVRVLRTVGFDRQYQRGSGQYLYDAEGEQYLDLLSGWGVFALGRNHPAMREALKGVLDVELPNLVQLDLSALAGVLAERLLLCEFRHRDGRGRTEICARRNRPPRHRVLLARVSRVELWGAVGKRGPGFPLRFWAAAAELRRSAIQ
jgi:Aminotransferase class-III